jgi:hypothetical protein
MKMLSSVLAVPVVPELSVPEAAVVPALPQAHNANTIVSARMTAITFFIFSSLKN